MIKSDRDCVRKAKVVQILSPESGRANLELQENNHQSPLQIQKKPQGLQQTEREHPL